MRRQFQGTLTVYRESVMVERLSAKVQLKEGNVFYYYPCPKGFDELITDGALNNVSVEFTANADSNLDNYGGNPRSIKAIGQCHG